MKIVAYSTLAILSSIISESSNKNILTHMEIMVITNKLLSHLTFVSSCIANPPIKHRRILTLSNHLYPIQRLASEQCYPVSFEVLNVVCQSHVDMPLREQYVR